MSYEILIEREELLHQVAKDYVLKGLGGKNFDAIPYHDDVLLRAPLCPGGSENPLKGKENLRTQWWAPLPGLVGRVKVIDSFVNKSNTAVTVEFHCEIINPACILRVVDRFIVNDDGQITEQENFFDPRDVTHTGWKD
jgi:hypothetical protein